MSRVSLIVVSVLAVVTVGSTSEPRDNLVALRALKRNPFASVLDVFNLARKEDPRISFETVADCHHSVFLLARVPEWLHSHLKTVHHSAIAIDQTLIDEIKNLAALHKYSLNTVKIESVIKAWRWHCLDSSIILGREMCLPDGQGNMILDPFQMDLMIDSFIKLQEQNFRKQLSALSKTAHLSIEDIPPNLLDEIASRFRRDIFTDPKILAFDFGVSEHVAKYIQNFLLQIFVQPSWFLQLLFEFDGPGPLSASNDNLLEAIRREADWHPHASINGPLVAVVQAWIEVCILPIREGTIERFPYIVQDVSIGRFSGQIVHIRPEIVHKYYSALS